MSPIVHRVYISTLVTIVASTACFLAYSGYSYYTTPLEERFFHPRHDWFKPSGAFGHGLGIVGTLLILLGVFGYMGIKRTRLLSKMGRLKYWLEFHIFLCTLGPVMILFHTAFKFGGIVSVSFWSMVAVVASGVIGRFIYVQIPRSLEGREFSLQELHAMRKELTESLRTDYGLDEETVRFIEDISEQPVNGGGNLMVQFVRRWMADRRAIRGVVTRLRAKGTDGKIVKAIRRNFRKELTLRSRINRLQHMIRLFKYWHVAHLPFALIMLIIMIIHVWVTLAFGYRWIF